MEGKKNTLCLIFYNVSPPDTKYTRIKTTSLPAQDGIKPMRSVEGSNNEQRSALALPHTHARAHAHTRCKLNVSHCLSLSLLGLWWDVCVWQKEGGRGKERERLGRRVGERHSPSCSPRSAVRPGCTARVSQSLTANMWTPRTKQVHPTHE